MRGSIGHLLQQGSLLAQTLNRFFVLLDGEFHVADDAVVALLLLTKDFLKVCQDFLQTLIALLCLHLLHCHLLQVYLVLL